MTFEKICWRIFLLTISCPVGCPPNNGLYRRQLDCLSATNLLLYEIISYKYSHFFYSSLMKIFVFFRSNASIFKFTFSAAYSRILPLHCIALKLNILSESKLDLLSEIFLFYNQFFAQSLRFNSFFNRA